MRKLSQRELTPAPPPIVGRGAGVPAQHAGSMVPLLTSTSRCWFCIVSETSASACSFAWGVLISLLAWAHLLPKCFSNKPRLVTAWLQCPGCRVKTPSLERWFQLRRAQAGHVCERVLRAPCVEPPPAAPLQPLPVCPVWRTLIDLSDQAHGHSKDGYPSQSTPPCLGPYRPCAPSPVGTGGVITTCCGGFPFSPSAP